MKKIKVVAILGMVLGAFAANASTDAPAADKDNMFIFKGGFASLGSARSDGVSINNPTALNAIGLALPTDGNSKKNGWNLGAGFDFKVSPNVFGMIKNADVFAELMFDYKSFGSTKGNALANARVDVTQFTLSAAPKIKFMTNTRFNPWISPVGFSFNVISPPSNSITVMSPGILFGAGAEYKLFQNVKVGADARYNLVSSVDGVNISGYTVGGYLGLGF